MLLCWQLRSWPTPILPQPLCILFWRSSWRPSPGASRGQISVFRLPTLQCYRPKQTLLLSSHLDLDAVTEMGRTRGSDVRPLADMPRQAPALSSHPDLTVVHTHCSRPPVSQPLSHPLESASCIPLLCTQACICLHSASLGGALMVVPGDPVQYPILFSQIHTSPSLWHQLVPCPYARPESTPLCYHLPSSDMQTERDSDVVLA